MLIPYHMGTLFFVFIILIVIGGIIVKVMFWGFVVRFFINYASKFEEEERQLYALINQYSISQQGAGKSKKKHAKIEMSDREKQQILTRMNRMQSHLSHMDSFQKQRYETRMSGMIGSVSGAGFTNFNVSDYY